MSFDASSELGEGNKISEINSPTTEARNEVHKLFGLPGDFIESPDKAKSFIRLDNFWLKTVSSDLDIPKDKEIFLGFDFDVSSGKIACTETTLGEADHHEPKRNHLIMLHTEPAYSPEDMSLNLGPVHLFKPSKTAVFADNIPQPYTGDMQFMLRDPSIYANIIIRLGLNNDPAAILVAIRTNQFKNIYKKLLSYELKNFALDEKHPLSQKLSEDKIITQEGGIAIYRGFTSLPPKHDDILRLRKFN
jgi:hypothetical protein